MAARIRRIMHDDNTRAKIKTSQIMNRLTNHILGELELSSTQIAAAKILLSKTLPDLTNIDVNAVVGVKEMTHEEWLSELKGGDDGSSIDSTAKRLTD